MKLPVLGHRFSILPLSVKAIPNQPKITTYFHVKDRSKERCRKKNSENRSSGNIIKQAHSVYLIDKGKYHTYGTSLMPQCDDIIKYSRENTNYIMK